jgi:predicted Zn-dependent protease
MKKLPFLNRWLRQGVVFGLLPVSLALGACGGISTQEEVQMGAQAASDISRQLPIVGDASVHRNINLLGDEIARYGKRGLNYTFYVVDASQINAFAVPGGYIYINRGLIERTTSYAELAGVLAHEIGHVEERHGMEQMEKMQTANLGLNVAYVLLGRAPSTVERAAIQVGGGAIFARYSREAENEADRVAVPLMLSARVNPNGLVTMFQKLMAEQQTQPSRVATWFSTHPTTQDRVEETRRNIARVSPQQLSGLRSGSSTYDQLKSRLRQLPPPRDRTTGAR